MKDISNYVYESQGLVSFIQDNSDIQVDEGLRDIFNTLKAKFKKVVQFVFGFVARLTGNQPYWCPVDDKGDVLSANSYLTAGQAFADGLIDIANTIVVMSNSGRRVTGCKGKPEDANKLYGEGNSLAYWGSLLKESKIDINDPNLSSILESYNDNFSKLINEVKLHTDDPQARGNVVDTPMLMRVIKMTLKNKKLPKLLIMGAPGIGKTAILNAVLKSLPGFEDYNLVVKTLSNETPDNFTLPKYIEVNGQQKATDVPKTWLPVYKPSGDPATDQQMDDACGKGLLFIDELSRATPQVLNVILPLINEGVFNGYKMGSGWTIICASNRMEDELSGQAPIGNALANRFQIVYYEPTCKTWSEWAKTQGYISPLLLQWLNMPESENGGGGKYFYWDPNESGEDDPSLIMCTPRSWTNAMQVLASYADTASLEGFKIVDIYREEPEILRLALNSCIPAEAVESFISFLDVIKTLGDKGGGFDNVVKSIWSKGTAPKISAGDLNKVALPLSQLIIASHSNKLPTEQEFTNLAKWMVKQDSEQIASYMLDIILNVFAGVLPEASRGNIFGIAMNYKQSNAQEKRLYDERAYKSLLTKWGLTSCADFPDWYPGFELLCDKYGDTFEKTMVDGQSALG